MTLVVVPGMGVCAATAEPEFPCRPESGNCAAVLLLPAGALPPVEAMPHWMQPLTVLNPIRHFGIITRSVLLKGSGIGEVWPNLLALVVFTVVLLSLSVMRFRKQLG